MFIISLNNTYNLRSKEETTTETELIAIAAEPIHGWEQIKEKYLFVLIKLPPLF